MTPSTFISEYFTCLVIHISGIIYEQKVNVILNIMPMRDNYVKYCDESLLYICVPYLDKVGIINTNLRASKRFQLYTPSLCHTAPHWG